MRLIANKPCSFGGRKFYIGDEIPENLVADARLQEKLGVITIVNDVMGVSGEKPGSLFTQEQVEAMIAEAMDEAEKKRADQLAELQEHVAELEKWGLVNTMVRFRFLSKENPMNSRLQFRQLPRRFSRYSALCR